MQTATPGSSFPPSLPPPQAVAAPVSRAPYSGKQAVPCVYFQKGYCYRGDQCAFLHGPSPGTTSKGSQGAAAFSGSELPNHKKVSAGLEKCTQGKKTSGNSMEKATEAVPSGNGIRANSNSKPALSEVAPSRNGVASGKGLHQPAGIDRDHQRHKQSSISPVLNGSSTSGSNRLYQSQISDNQSIQSSKDADECLRESSPGFDVLVDDELGDADYYHNEDQYGRARGPEGEYDHGRSADYRDSDRELFHEAHHYDSYDRHAAWEDDRTSAERRFLRQSNHERRKYPVSESTDQVDESDLRYRLSKQRRLNDLRSVVSHDFLHEREERSHRSSRRESSHLPVRESSLSSRLRGRIKLPGRTSDDGMEMNSDRDRGRSSSRGFQVSSHQSRFSDRSKGRFQEDNEHDGRSFRGHKMRREIMDDKTDFAGPKRLAELKNKVRQTKDFHSLDNQQSEQDLSFEGPKPLSEILKRKRGSESSGTGNIMQSDNNGGNLESRSEQYLEGSTRSAAVTEKQSGHPSMSKDEVGNQEVKSKDEAKSVSSDMNKSADEKTDIAHEIGTEDGMIGDEALGDHEYGAGDQGEEEEYYYEEGEEGDYNYDEGEYVEGEEEYVQDEDDDEYSKKMDVISS